MGVGAGNFSKGGNGGARGLWAAVLMQAIADAGTSDTVQDRYAAQERDQARRYLTTPSADLARVCDYAGIDHEALLAFARRQPWAK